MSAEIIRLPQLPRRRLEEDLAAQMAALFPQLPKHLQRAYLALLRFHVGEDEDDERLEATYEPLIRLQDDVESLLLECAE